MAHRADFDRGFIAADAPKLAARLPWVCSKYDVEWPSCKVGASCVEMALSHGVPVVSAHRALTDCMLIASTLAEVSKAHDVEAMIRLAMRPRALFAVADRSFDETRNTQARELGFKFNRPEKRWEKRMSVDATEGLPFAVEEVS
jgi:DNA polymerase-3 subunit epsilon